MTILIVDDEEPIRRLLGRVLEANGFECLLASDATDARAHLAREDLELMLCDVQMPGESGLELLRSLLDDGSDLAAIMMSGRDDAQLAEIALELGAYGYITKPFKRNEVVIGVTNALRRRRLEVDNREHRGRLEQMVVERTAALRESREETIRRLSRAVEYRDEETGGHIERMSRYCGFLAERLGLDAERIRIASPMHDVGKIALPERILTKPGPLNAAEYAAMRRHAEIGHAILAGSNSELLELAATIAWTHHERCDGGGYPRGLAREEIPIEGRIAGVADVFDALTSDRVYRPAFSVEKAVEIMRAERGRHFDPAVLDVLLTSLDEVLAIRARYSEPREVAA